MQLCNVRMPGQDFAVNISTQNELITSVARNAAADESVIFFDRAFAFPGLINSHDHLDFNLFPQLAQPPYNDYTEWAKDLHEKHRDKISEVLRVPRHLRMAWGIFKNLLNGVTIVAEHGNAFPDSDDPVAVLRNQRILHSPAFEKYWQLKLNRPFRGNSPVVMHAGEGINLRAGRELDELHRWNMLSKKLVVIHGIQMTVRQAARFEALIWCPDSNEYLFGSGPDVATLQHHIPILFGTDSTLTSSWNMWPGLASIHRQGILPGGKLLDTLTVNPAKTWQLENTGVLQPGMIADICISQASGQDWQSFFNGGPKDLLLVLQRGRIQMFDERIADQVLPILNAQEFSTVLVDGAMKYVRGNLATLVGEIRTYYPEAIPFIQLPAHVESR